MNGFISIVIPAYNVEKYIRQCLDSVINQTYKNIEIILVDDGSTDSTGKICDEYEKKYDKIKLVHKENGGLSSARNVGIDMASGDYVAFVDSDDFLLPNMYESMVNTMESTNSDIVVCDYYNFTSKGNVTYSQNTGQITELSSVHDYFMHILDPYPVLRFEVWNKLYKKDTIGSIRFKLGQVYEDIYFDRNVFPRAKKITHIDNGYYMYRVSRPGNSNSSFNPNRFSVFKELEDFISDGYRLNDIDIARRYTKFAAETAISLHYLASIHNGDSKTKNELITTFKKYYNKGEYSSYRHFIFLISPKLFRMLSSLKTLLKKHV